MSVLAIIQARMNSQRLAGKVLMSLHGKPMLEWVIEAAENARKIDWVLVATSKEETDDPIAQHMIARKYAGRPDDADEEAFVHLHARPTFVRGDLDDVLGRFYHATRHLQPKPEHVVRLTGDCPLLIPRVINDVIAQHINDGNDYTSNRPAWPSGFDVEVMTMHALEIAYAEATEQPEREHVTLFFKNNPWRFKLGYYTEGAPNLPGKWSVDTIDDYYRVSFAFEEMKQL